MMTAEAFRSEHSSANRATSFADIELFYEINMAKKIFVKPTLSTIVDTELNPTTVE